jgi:hypothetical protein
MTIHYQCLHPISVIMFNISEANKLIARSTNQQLIEDLQLANAIRKEMLVVYYN